jgi:hypothetical protein
MRVFRRSVEDYLRDSRTHDTNAPAGAGCPTLPSPDVAA